MGNSGASAVGIVCSIVCACVCVCMYVYVYVYAQYAHRDRERAHNVSVRIPRVEQPVHHDVQWLSFAATSCPDIMQRTEESVARQIRGR